MMRRFLFSTGSGLAIAAAAAGQTPNVTVAPQPSPGMPGITVGTMPAGSGVRPVGTPLPKAAPAVGTRVGGSGLPGTIPPVGPGVPGAATQPQGKPIDLKNVVAPYPNMPKELTVWEKIEARYFALLLPDEPVLKAPNDTPGIRRRIKERDKARLRRWDRD